MSSSNEIAILDFGFQYTHLIARRIRELGVVSHIYPNDVPFKKIKNAVGIILSGGPRSVVREPILPYDPELFKKKLPILGLCYGQQLMAQVLGGSVTSGGGREYGLAKMTVTKSPLFKNVKKNTTVWMSHGDHVAKLPKRFTTIAETGNGSITAMADEKNKHYGLQFHPEVTHTKEGRVMLENFIFDICKAKKNWSTNQMLAEIEDEIRKQANTVIPTTHSLRSVQTPEESLAQSPNGQSLSKPEIPRRPRGLARDDKKKNVFLLVSGGVDSTVCFALLEKVLGKKRVYGLHIDNGFMRLNETKKITVALKKLGYDNLHIYNAEKEFLGALKGVSEPEQKRKIIGNLFLDITDRIMKKKDLDSDKWLLGQGTIYPDTIESGGTKNADVIKTHHNRVPRVQQMIAEGKIIEPIKELYKDEVRAIGMRLGLPKELVWRHPFPGPGLAIRCLCSEGSSEVATPFCHPERSEGSLAHQSIGFFKLPIKSVGVQGDERSYAHPAVIVSPLPRGEGRRVRATRWPDWKKLATLSPTITNTHKDINRVLWLVSGEEKKLTEAKLNKAFLTKKRLELLRTIDDIVMSAIAKDPRCNKIWQLPTILIPFGYNHGESIVLRPFESEEVMTVSFGKIPANILQKIIKKINALNAIDFIFYDLTNKPPGTVEWE